MTYVHSTIPTFSFGPYRLLASHLTRKLVNRLTIDTIAGGEISNCREPLEVIMHKRKRRKPVRNDNWEQSTHTTGTSRVLIQSTYSTENPDSPAPDPCLYVEAYEADVIPGPPTVCTLPRVFGPITHDKRR
ncbi:hypothetical protein J3R83DRAFT_9278 [Lanmaoa asiatica]|nr:hypothetical protein J3R83DRAFT_9278 [Lanmaoa asiatica]